MKKYKLKKDFPGSKIGEVWVKEDNGFMSPYGRDNIKMHEHLFEPFNDWFEKCEEPKEYWCISEFGHIKGPVVSFEEDMMDSQRKEIGNYFETREEAEKAMECLRAWKRLKDKGMIKYSFRREKRGIDLDYYTLTILAPRDKDSLNLLFGGEE